jgi:hypothetical protein
MAMTVFVSKKPKTVAEEKKRVKRALEVAEQKPKKVKK